MGRRKGKEKDGEDSEEESNRRGGEGGMSARWYMMKREVGGI